ncbi:MAG: hypothetical protein U1B30_07315 [Pseudomonadota bacterium]|nr:hypothetical protein [Pseudomonadota bacterium]
MAKDTLTGHAHLGHFPFKRVCWTAVLSGALVAIGLSFLFNLFFVATSLSAFTLNPTGATVLVIGGAIGLFIAVIVSMLISGYVAGYLGRHFTPQRNLGILYGFLTWTLALVLSAWMVGSFAHYTKIYSHSIGTNSYRVYQTKNESINVQNAPDRKTDDIKVSKEDLASGAFLIFALFFVGAAATCVGATCGMNCRRND